jgi:N-acetyl-S-(2-succino)cysteine monooxygenase
MILTASFGSATTPPTYRLSHHQSLVTAVARAGFDAALFVRSPGPTAPMLDAVPLIAALASVPVSIGLGAGIPVEYTEPFHLARAFAAIDRLTRGRSAVVLDLAATADLTAAIGRTAAAGYGKAIELLEATTKLWDSWEDDAILVDRPAGLFTDPGKIHRINHDGAHYSVRGPLNAPRPIQGWPVIVVPVASAASHAFAAQAADVALLAASSQDAAQRARARMLEMAEAFGRPPGATRILVDVFPTFGRTGADPQRAANPFTGTPARVADLMRTWHDAGACDGFNLLSPDLPAEADLIAACLTTLARTTPDGTTLRQRLGLPRPPSRYAA